jgi:crossover junction endodeoxyribonuclease RuvC
VSGGLPVAEYTALQMKKAVVGHGLANKDAGAGDGQAAAQAARLPGKDAADALGLAISHAHAGASFAALAQAAPLARRQHAQYRKGRTY